MVRGLSTFREHFAGWEDRYVLIGGAAAVVMLEQAGLTARATKDLDVVLLVESLDASFGRVVWDFVLAGEYEHRRRGTGDNCFYRFDSPSNPSFPMIIELFSRKPDGLVLPDGAVVTPLPIADEVSSLSAILLDDDYYRFVQVGVAQIDGLGVLMPEHLIPLKARAWIDLTAKKAAGAQVDSSDIKKHRNDVVRLYQLIGPSTRVVLPPVIASDMREFLEVAFNDGFEPKQLKVAAPTSEILAALRAVYGLGV